MSIYNPEKTTNFEAMLRYAAQQAMGNLPPFECPVAVEIEAGFAIPKSMTQKKREQMMTGKHPVLKKPDIDNVQKSVFDAMNKVVFMDDSQVWLVRARKVYSDKPSIKVKIMPAKIEDIIG